MKRVQVNNHSAQWLKKGFCWVYPNEVVGKPPRPGELIELRDAKGESLGTGIADQGFLAVRRFRSTPGPLDRAWLSEVLDRAVALREAVVDPETDGYRLVHAENDGMPGVRIDRWRSWFVVILDRPTLGKLVEPIVEELKERFQPRGIALCYRPDSRDESFDPATARPAPGLLFGHPPPGPIKVRERGISFEVLPLDGPDVGLYSDMREVRRWMEPFWGGMSVLNTFAYTGAFSVVAAMHGAMEVVTTDLSAPYLERAKANFAANGLDPADHTFLCSDTFKALDRFRRTGQHFDRIVVDPPSFSHSSAGIWSAKRDWPRLVASAARVTNPGGWLILASNQGELSPKQFDGYIADGLRRAGRVGQLLHSTGQGPDHPAATTFPEGRYLKVRVMALA